MIDYSPPGRRRFPDGFVWGASTSRPRAFTTDENRLCLDSVLLGRYPDDVLADQGAGGPMANSIKDGDMATIASANAV